MMACLRPECPVWLDQHWKKWGQQYTNKLQVNPGHQFAWKSFEGFKVNHRLLPLLREMTAEHCAYCDWFPTDVGTDSTIDHFRPKRQYSREAYHWPNLYLCCRTCQSKNDDDFSDDLLRPDETGYDFERFFLYNYRDGTLVANPAASADDRDRATLTIQHLKLNEGGRPAARQRVIDQFRRWSASDRLELIPTQPFRYLLGAELDS